MLIVSLKRSATFRFDSESKFCYEYDFLVFQLVMLTTRSSAVLEVNMSVATIFDPTTSLRIGSRLFSAGASSQKNWLSERAWRVRGTNEASPISPTLCTTSTAKSRSQLVGSVRQDTKKQTGASAVQASLRTSVTNLIVPISHTLCQIQRCLFAFWWLWPLENFNFIYIWCTFNWILLEMSWKNLKDTPVKSWLFYIAKVCEP